MLCLRQTSNLLVLCALILTAGFILQIKVLYNNYQKHLKIQDIRERMAEFHEHLADVTYVANTTDILMKKLANKMRSTVNIKKRRRRQWR